MTTLLLLAFAAALQGAAPAPTLLARSAMSGVDEPRQMVARTEAEWRSLWRLHAGDKPAPTVDLATSTVVAVFLGTRMSGGFAVDITGTRRQGDALVVEWSERRPGRDDVAAQVITSPAAIAAVPRFTGEIRFEKVDR